MSVIAKAIADRQSEILFHSVRTASAEQRDAVRSVLEESREALREAGEQARASRQALRDAVGTRRRRRRGRDP